MYEPKILQNPEIVAHLEKVGQAIYMAAFRKTVSDKALEAAKYLQERGIFNAD